MFSFLGHMSNVVGFTTLTPDSSSQDPHNPINVHLPQQRVAITVPDDGGPTMPGAWISYVPVPPAKLGPGVLDEGANWPRFVIYDGECVWMKREEWDMLKLSGNWECTIPSTGYPVACLRRLDGPVPPEPSFAEKYFPEANANANAKSQPHASASPHRGKENVAPPRRSASRVSLASAMSVDTARPTRLSSAMSVDTVRPTRLASAMSVDTVRPSRSGAQFTSYMSVDSIAPADRMSVDPDELYPFEGMFPIAEEDEDDGRAATPTPGDRARSLTPASGPAPKKKKLERTTSSASLPKVAGQKRPVHHQHREKHVSPPPKRHHGVEEPVPKTSHRERAKQRASRRYESPRQKRQRERAEYHQRRRQLADEAFILELRAEAAQHAEHQARLMELRARLAEMDRVEREARRREELRVEEAHALAARRRERHLCAPYEGLVAWRRRCSEFSEKRKARPRQIDDIPFPVLLRSPYSLTLVTYDEVNLFFHEVLPFVDRNDRELLSMFKKLRTQLHPDKFTKRDYAVIEGCEEENGKMLVKVATEVMQWINPHMNDFLDAVASGEHFKGIPTGL